MLSQRYRPLTRAGLLDRIGVKAQAGYSSVESLLRSYRGPLITGRRASDSATLDINTIALTGKFNREQAKTFGSATSVFVTKAWDHTGNGRHLTQGTTGKQPRIVNAGVLDVNANGRPAITFDGTDDTLTRADALGFVGSQDITVGWTCTLGNAASTFSNPWGIGGTAVTGVSLACGSNNSATQMNMTRGGAFFRTLTAVNLVNPHYYVARWAAGAAVSTMDLRQDGVTLSGSTTGAAGTVSYLNQSFTIGSFFDTIGAGFINGWMTTMVVFKAVLTGTDLTTLETGLAAHV